MPYNISTNDFRPNTEGKHLIVDFYKCAGIEFNMNELSLLKLYGVLRKAIRLTGLNIIDFLDFNYGGKKYSIIFLLAESHFAVHIQLEECFVSFDIYICGDIDLTKTLDALKEYFKPKYSMQELITRGSGLTTRFKSEIL